MLSLYVVCSRTRIHMYLVWYNTRCTVHDNTKDGAADCDRWPSTFWGPAALVLAWSVLWGGLWSSHPENCRWITAEELQIIASSRVAPKSAKGRSSHRGQSHGTPQWTALRSPLFYGSVAAGMASGFGFYTLLSFLPLYMSGQLGFSLKKSGAIALLPYISMLLGKVL